MQTLMRERKISFPYLRPCLQKKMVLHVVSKACDMQGKETPERGLKSQRPQKAETTKWGVFAQGSPRIFNPQFRATRAVRIHEWEEKCDHGSASAQSLGCWFRKSKHHLMSQCSVSSLQHSIHTHTQFSPRSHK